MLHDKELDFTTLALRRVHKSLQLDSSVVVPCFCLLFNTANSIVWIAAFVSRLPNLTYWPGLASEDDHFGPILRSGVLET